MIAVLGPGAVGGMLAARTGAICVGTERTVEAILGAGITLVQGETTTVAHPVATERLEEPVSLLIVAVKAPNLDAALERVDPNALEGALVLPLLNGLEHVGRIRAQLDAPVAAGSIAHFEAYAPEPGLVVQRSPGALISAASRELGRAELETRLEPLRGEWIELQVVDEERAVLWEKAARLAVLAAATSAAAKPVGALRDDPTWRRRLDATLREACAVAAADGVLLDPAEQWEIIESMPPSLTTSTARDVAAGRPSELDAITGSVARAARRLAVATPELDALLEDACRPR